MVVVGTAAIVPPGGPSWAAAGWKLALELRAGAPAGGSSAPLRFSGAGPRLSLYMAALQGHTDIVRCLVERPGLDVNQA